MAVQRFLLDTSQLDDANFGLDGPSGRSFILDTSELDGADVLNGSPFLTIATGTATLGGLVASASADVQATVFAIASTELGGLTSTATATVLLSATASANLGGLVASATATVVLPATASANLGGLAASAITAVAQDAVATANLGGLVATATASDAPAPPTPPAPEPTPSGGRRVYSTYPRKKIEPLPQVEIPVIQPKRRYAVASAILGGATCTATSSITFSILDDDAEVLLLV
tara:strand:+ start:290 stop:988 length:699 start_codon:yes stop_codon:yes gene_type:complete